MMNTNNLLAQKWDAATGTPDAGTPFLFRATPQHGNRRMASSLGSQPESGRAFSRPNRRHPRRYEMTAARDTHSTIRAICALWNAPSGPSVLVM
ncbi:MAG: hypothetical protein QOG50_2297 [Actinomycetota bacterium]|nr:hypothetical protein [Actinomycetota bacterium]